MNFDSVWPMLAIVAALLAVAATPLFKAADSPPIPARSRVGTLDGLRGFLALAVFFHHGALYHGFMQDGVWRAPPNRLYNLLGSFGVSMFFMITGFLFWSQILAKQGRPDWVRLYVGRLFRIGPLYLVAVYTMMLAVFAITGPQLHGSPIGLVGAIVQWSALGLQSGAPINGFGHPGIFLADVTWSLRWEWFFYASLLVTGLFARTRHGGWALPAAGLALSMAVLVQDGLSAYIEGVAAFVALFSVGMLTAALREHVKTIDFRLTWFSLLSAALILTVLALFSTTYAAAPIVLLGGAFFLIANGATLFGLLETRAARRLGDISFGIYLLQGLVLAGLFGTPQARAFALASPLQHWCLIALAGGLLIVVATVAHAWIERPGIDLGRRALEISRHPRWARGRADVVQ